VNYADRGLQRAVNVEQAPKSKMRKPTVPRRWEGCYDEGSERHMHLAISAGVLTAARVHREIDATREVPGLPRD
jgi:hypothetical protein